jgi:hypothetical protein
MDAKHPIWKLAEGVIVAAVLIFALSPFSGLYNSWTRSDIFTVMAVLASWAGFQLPLFRLGTQSQPTNSKGDET